MKVRVIFFSGNHLYARLIRFSNNIAYIRKYGFNRFFTDERRDEVKWNHIGLIADEDSDNYVIYEALNQGLVKNNHRKNVLKRRIEDQEVEIKSIYIHGTDVEQVIKYCEKYKGNLYDWKSIFHIGLYTIFGNYGLHMSKGAKKLICSEFVARVLYEISDKKINFEEEFNKPYDYITPADLYQSRQIK